MSQTLGAEDPIWASLPIAKFSHVIGHSGRRFPPWAHVSTKNLNLVIQAIRVVDGYGSYDRRVVMRISAGAETLESQDLGQLVQLHRQNDSSTDPERTVEVQFTSPRLAMRYPKSVENIRKIQVRFQSDSDFTKAINIISDLGLPVKPAGSSQISRPLASPVLLPPSATPIPISQQTAQSRPASAFSSLNRNASFGLPSSSPYTDFKVPKRPATAEVQRNIPIFSQRPTRADAPFVPALVTPPISSPSRGSSPHQSVKPLYPSQMESESQNRRMSKPVSQEFDQGGPGGTKYQISSSVFLRQMQAQREDIAERMDSTSRLISASPFFTSLSTSRPAAPESPDPFLNSNPPVSQRPASTPADIQDLFIPPRRELPFARPEPKPRPSSAIDLPVLPKPTPVSTSSPKKPANDEKTRVPAPKSAPIKRVAQRKGPLSRSTQNNVSEEGSPIKPLTRETTITPPLPPEDEPSPLAAKSAVVAASRPVSATPGLVSKASASTKKRAAAPIRPPSNDKRPKVVDQSTQTQPSPGNDHTRNERAPQRSDVPDLVPDIGSTVSTPDSYLNALDAFIAKHKARPAPKELWQMPSYADADAERRQMILNDFICENLENPDFLQLCVDTETAWRRIGLGM